MDIAAASAYMARSYSTAQSDLSSALARLGTQQRFQTASEDVTSFLRAASLKSNRARYETARDSSVAAQGTMDAADSWASEMITALENLKAALGTDSETAVRSVVNAAANATLGGVNMNTANVTAKVRLVDGSTNTINLAAANISDGLADVAAINTAIASLQGYVSSIGANAGLVSANQEFASSMVQNTRAAENTLVAIDQAAEMAKYTDADIRQQAAVAVMSQANISRRSILTLFR